MISPLWEIYAEITNLNDFGSKADNSSDDGDILREGADLGLFPNAKFCKKWLKWMGFYGQINYKNRKVWRFLIPGVRFPIGVQ